MKRFLPILAVLLFFSYVPTIQAVDYDAYTDPYAYPEGRARDNAYQRRQQGQYNNEMSRRQREDDRYWHEVQRENQNRNYDSYMEQQRRYEADEKAFRRRIRGY